MVVSAGAEPEEREDWRELEQSDAVKESHGRFYSFLVAFEDGEPSLPEVLANLQQRGRSNVLIVPALFCADAQRMRRLRDQATEYGDRMSLSWLPGLGGQLP